jgi:pimeloyl-ACP methyl ester carboxylesterase
MANPSPHKSTTVRHWWKMALGRVLLRRLGEIAPNFAAERMKRRYLTPPRSQPRPDSRAILAHGLALHLTFGRHRLAAWSWGEGPTVALLHGWGGNAGQMTPFVEPLVAAGFRVVAADAPAHGASPGTLSSLPDLARLVARIALDEGPLHGVIAHSLGGAAATLAMADGLDVERAVFIAPPIDGERWFHHFAAQSGASAEVTAEAKRRIAQYAGLDWRRMNLAVAIRQNPRLNRPLLVLHDEDDRQVPWHAGAVVAQDWPQARLITTRGLGHNRILRDPLVVESAIAFMHARAGAAAQVAA